MFQNVVQAVRDKKLAERTGMSLENGKGKWKLVRALNLQAR
jgi:hypothetical protein